MTGLRGWLDPMNSTLQVLALSDVGGLANASLDASFASTYRNLTGLVLSGLGLSGPLPNWSALPPGKLALLDLSRNRFSGPLPAWATGAVGAFNPVPGADNVLLPALMKPAPFGPPVWWGPGPVPWQLDLSANEFTGAAARGCLTG